MKTDVTRKTVSALATLAFLFAATAVADAATPGAGNPSSGLGTPGALTTQNVCAAPSPGTASCYAQVEVNRSDRRPVNLRPAASTPVQRTATSFAGPVRVAASAPAPAAAPEPGPGTPAYLQQAYDLGSLAQTAGSGDTVAVVDAYDDPTAEADLAAYRAQFGLPACTTANGCFRKADENGGTSYPSANRGWDLEISLDLQAVSALCPNCHILLVEAAAADLSDLAIAQQRAAFLGARQISDSWGAVAASDPGYTWTFPGVATVAATGDNGYLGSAGNVYPAARPGVNAAGGTTLQPAQASGIASLRGFTETAWSGAGSGCNTAVSQPAWQAGGACGGRAYADISAVADPNTGFIAYDSGYGGWLQVGGTSEATPLVAAYYAITGANASSSAWPYANSALLNDPLSGTNGSCAAPLAYICNAGTGYDGPTGAGSISGAVAPSAPGIAGPGVGGSDTQSATADSAVLAGGVYPNGQDSSYFWEYGTTTAYGQQTATVDIGGGTAPVAVTGTLANLEQGATYHYRLVAQNSLGASYGYDFTTSVPATPPTVSATPPTVSAAPASAISTNGATLSGVANPQGLAAIYQFSYGTSTAYGSSTPSQQLSGSSDTAISQALSGLQPGTTYHFTLTAINSAGTTTSPDQTFTTAQAPRLQTKSAASPPPTSAPVGTPPVGTPPVGTPPVVTRVAASRVELGRIRVSGGQVAVVLRCLGASACRTRVRLSAPAGGPAWTPLLATVSIRPGATVTVRLTLGRRIQNHHVRLVVSLQHPQGYQVAAARTVGLGSPFGR